MLLGTVAVVLLVGAAVMAVLLLKGVVTGGAGESGDGGDVGVDGGSSPSAVPASFLFPSRHIAIPFPTAAHPLPSGFACL